MKNITLKVITIIIVFSLTGLSQTYKTSWGFYFGGSYPRFVGITPPSYSSTVGYGGFIALKKNFSEHSGIRLSLNYNNIHSDYTIDNNLHIQKLNLFGSDLDYLYYFTPCEPASFYASFGLGGMIYTSKNSPLPEYDGWSNAYQINIGFGVEWRLSENWNLITELSHHTASSNDLDGRDIVDNKGLFGSSADSYNFAKGEPSKLCDLYSGINIPEQKEIDYDKIENIVKKYAPKEEAGKVVVGQPAELEHWVLVGVEFEFNSARLTQGSYPMLFYSFEVLQNHPEMKVEIEGHTDNIGTNEFNLWLSLQRAQTVKDYLVAKGIDPNRLVVKGFGEEQPRATNKTPQGRALNRRIEFKIIK